MSVKRFTFQERLNELLDSLPYTDTQISRMLSVSKQTVSAWRTGIRSPKAPTVQHIANTFGVNQKWLIGFDCDKYIPEEAKETVTPLQQELIDKILHLPADKLQALIVVIDSMLQ